MKFNRKERQHMETLQQRFEFLTNQTPEQHAAAKSQPGFFPGEVQALSWALSTLEGALSPVEYRIQRLEREARKFGERLFRVEKELEESYVDN